MTLPMTVSRAIELYEKEAKCTELDMTTNCGFCDNDNCYECPNFVDVKDYKEALDTLYHYAKERCKNDIQKDEE